MTTANREQAIKATLKWEGGYCNDANDPGGPTNHGITIADARKYWKKNATAQDVKAMPLDIAVDIYRTKYWKTSFYDCDKLPSGVDLAVFDFGVNSGPSRSKRYYDASIGKTNLETINNLFDRREAFLKGLTIYPTFGKGWMNRTHDLRKLSISMSDAPITTKHDDKAVPSAATAAAGYAVWSQWGFLGLGIAGAVLVAAYIAYRIYKGRHNEMAKVKAK